MDNRNLEERKLDDLARFLDAQIAQLQDLIADDGRYIPVRYFQGKLQAYSTIRCIVKGEEEE